MILDKSRSSRDFLFLYNKINKYKKMMKKKLLSISIILSLSVSVFLVQPARGDADSAVTYIKTKTASPWITMALAAKGESPNVDYLKTAGGSNATDYEAPILALAAAGKNPKTFPNADLIAALKIFHAGGQIGSASTLNDDIFGILALLAAGEPASDPAVSDAKNFILSNQNSNGGWGFAVGGTSDTNTTSMAVMALLEAGVAKTDSRIASAVGYLKSAQNADGGFPYDPASPWGTGSDASSDAWVISAISKLGEDPDGSSWSKNGASPVDHLLSLQTAGGYFEYQKGTGEDSFSPVTSSYAVIALAGKYYPVGVVSAPAVPNVNYKIEGSAGTVCEGGANAPNALDLVKTIASACGFSYDIADTSFGPYLKKIGSDEAHDLAGWIYAVNFVLPNIGATDYALKNGDYVIWHFGDFGWQPGGTEIGLNANIVAPTGGSGGEEAGGSISFSVSVSGGGSGMNFGEVSPGASKSQSVTIANQGAGNIYVESAVSGDEVFRNYVKVDGVSWRDFGANIASGSIDEAQVVLQIPASYSSPGSKTGKLIFWATTNK